MKYTSRDAQSNIQNLVEDVRAGTHIWNPGSEADPGMILLKALASNVDLLSFNLDTQVDEMYMQSATQIKSIRRLGVANGYVPGWYRAPRTTLTIENMSEDAVVSLDFTLPDAANNICYAATNALEDLTSIPYFVIPKPNAEYGDITDNDVVTLQPKGSVDVYQNRKDVATRQVAQGTLKSVIVNPRMMVTGTKGVNTLTYRLPAQNVDGELIWVQELTSTLDPIKFQNPEKPWTRDTKNDFVDSTQRRYQIAVDDYNNLIIVFNKFINDVIQYNRLIRVFYVETYGVAGEVSQNVISLSTVDSAVAQVLKVTHPANTLDMPDRSALTGKTPLTAPEAAAEAKNYVNTNDSIITLRNFTAWIRRQPGIDAGIAVDCQKALEVNWAYKFDEDMAEELKPKKYIMPGPDVNQGYDFPGWIASDPYDPLKGTMYTIGGKSYEFPHKFRINKLLFFCIFNNFLENWSTGLINEEGKQCMIGGASEWEGDTSEWSTEMVSTEHPYRRYRPSETIRAMITEQYLRTYNLTCDIDFGWVRVFEWSVNGIIWTNEPVTQSEADNLVQIVLKALRIRFHAANMEIGVLPRMMDIVDCVQQCDSRIRYFDAGLLNKPMINWGPVRDAEGKITDSNVTYDIAYFNAISFARFIDGDTEHYANSPVSQISVAKECILKD
jgi:hypothetical protein